MMNPAYHFKQMRELLREYEPSRELSLASTKLDECELWLTRCIPAAEAVQRDMRAPAPPVRDRQGVQFGDGNTQVNSF